MNTTDYDEFDKRKLRQAKNLAAEVYEYNYKAPGMAAKQNRLETIIKKLDHLLGEDQNKYKGRSYG